MCDVDSVLNIYSFTSPSMNFRVVTAIKQESSLCNLVLGSSDVTHTWLLYYLGITLMTVCNVVNEMDSYNLNVCCRENVEEMRSVFKKLSVAAH